MIQWVTRVVESQARKCGLDLAFFPFMNDESGTNPSTADHVGEAAGGIGGALAGAAIGATAGPIGSLLGGVAGAIGGWWSGRALAEAAEDITDADEQYYREQRANSGSDHSFDDGARGAYYLGVVAAANPDYAGRNFADIESDLARGWSAGASAHGAWTAVSPYAAMGYVRGIERRRLPRRRA